MPELFGSIYILPAIVVVVLLLVVLLLLLRRRNARAAETPRPETPKTSRKTRSAAELGATPGIQFTTATPSEQAAPAAATAQPPGPTETAPPEPAGRSSAPTDAIKDPLQLVILDILRIGGDITEDDTRRLGLFRPDKVLAITQSLELPKDLRSNENARSRLMQLRQYAATAVERTGAPQQPPAAPAEVPAEASLAGEALPSEEAAGVETPVPEEPLVTEEPPKPKAKNAFASAYGPDPTETEADDVFTATYETAVTAEAIGAASEAPLPDVTPTEATPVEGMATERSPVLDPAGAGDRLWPEDPADNETIIAGEGVFLVDAPRSEDELPSTGGEPEDWAQWQDMDPFAMPPVGEAQPAQPAQPVTPAPPEPKESEDIAGGEKRVEMVEEYLVESAAATVVESEPPFSFDEPSGASPGLIAKSIRRADDLLAQPEEERKEIVAFLDPVELAKVFDRTDDPELKKAIIDTLENVNNPSSLTVLRRCLEDTDPEIQMYALEAADRILGAD
jgi:hypothetical protein